MKHLVITLTLIIIALTSQGATSQCWFFKGKMADRVSVELCFQTDEQHEDIVAGYIYYPRVKHPEPILVVGSIDNGWMHLKEYLPDGAVSGILNFKLKQIGNEYVISEGEWINPKTFASYSLTTLRKSTGNHPSWWPGNPLSPSSISTIPGEYGFEEWNSGYDAMMGGSAEFTSVGKDSVHFNISNCWHNIAEGESRAERPAVIHGNEFEYDELNECGYGIRAIFFKKFVVIQTSVQPRSLDCFGFGASLNGVYIKTKSFE